MMFEAVNGFTIDDIVVVNGTAGLRDFDGNGVGRDAHLRFVLKVGLRCLRLGAVVGRA